MNYFAKYSLESDFEQPAMHTHIYCLYKKGKAPNTNCMCSITEQIISFKSLCDLRPFVKEPTPTDF